MFKEGGCSNDEEKSYVRLIQSKELSNKNPLHPKIYMAVEENKSVTVNRPRKVTWEHFEILREANTDREAISQVFGWTEVLWINN